MENKKKQKISNFSFILENEENTKNELLEKIDLGKLKNFPKEKEENLNKNFHIFSNTNDKEIKKRNFQSPMIISRKCPYGNTSPFFLNEKNPNKEKTNNSNKNNFEKVKKIYIFFNFLNFLYKKEY